MEYIACSVCELREGLPPTPTPEDGTESYGMRDPEDEVKKYIVSSVSEDTFDQFVHELREELPPGDKFDRCVRDLREELPPTPVSRSVKYDEVKKYIVSSVYEDTSSKSVCEEVVMKYDVSSVCEDKSGMRKEDLCKCKVEYNEDWENYWDTEEGKNSSFWTREKDKRTVRVRASIVKNMRKEDWLSNLNISEGRVWRSAEVLEEDLQDMEAPQVIVGCDVEALYPSLDPNECAEVVREEVMRTKIQWKDMDYVEGARMIALNRSAAWCRRSKMKRILPVRRGRTGVRPGVTGKGPMGGGRGDQEQWVFPTVRPTEEERRMIVAEVIAITTEGMFKHHLYTFGKKTHRQKEGGPIGLRGTCAIARLTMCTWDRRWLKRMDNLRVKILLYSRYMDDGRVHLPPFKCGWRWEEDDIKFKEAWRGEDADLSGEEITRRIIHGSMQGVMESLRFTTEIGEEEGGWLPTLDLQVRVEENNLVSFKYYEKPTVTNVMVQKRSAMGENEKVQILSNDMVRRLASTDPRQENSTRVKVVDQFARKILTSGYSLQQTRRIILGGIRGWRRRLERAKEESRSLYRKASSCQESRLRKKTLGKSTWFRKRKKKGDQAAAQDRGRKGRGGKPGVGRDDDKQLPTRSVLFVENSKDGELARRLRGVVERIQHILRFRIKVVEKSGTPLKLMFPLSNIGGEEVCGRDECITCTQEGEGKKPPCTRRSVLYENICKICNPGVMAAKEKLSPPLTNPSIYVGETARSIMERGADHWKGYREQREDSHILKHHVLHHGGVGEPSFHLRAVGYYNTALSRQVAEAVRIAEWGEEVVLNSKSEFNRCQLGRLTLEKEQKPVDPVAIEEECEVECLEEQRAWERNKSLTKRVEEVRSEGVLDRGLARSPPTKGRRKADSKDDGGGRSKRLKHPVMEDDWGERKDDIFGMEDDLGDSWRPKDQRPKLGLVRSGDQSKPLLSPPPTDSAVTGNQPDRQDGLGEEPTTHNVVAREGCQGDSTSRDDISTLCDIYSTKTQTSIVEYLTPENSRKEHRGQDPLMNRRLLEERKFQDDSPGRKKNNKKKTLPGPSSVRMVELMRKFVSRGQVGTGQDDGQGVSGTVLSNKEQVSECNQRVEVVQQEVQVSHKQSVSFASIDIRVKKTSSSSSVRDRVSAINGVNGELKCVLGSGRCGTHNTKLVRRVCEKKYSCIDPVTGKVVWKTRDVTSLECPAKAKRTGLAPGISGMSDQNFRGYNNNKKLRMDKK